MYPQANSVLLSLPSVVVFFYLLLIMGGMYLYALAICIREWSHQRPKSVLSCYNVLCLFFLSPSLLGPERHVIETMENGIATLSMFIYSHYK